MRPDDSVGKAEPEAGDVPGVEVAESEDATTETPFERDPAASIHMRLWLAAGEIGQLEKDGKAILKKGGQKIGEYDYITHDQVVKKAKAAFLKHGIMVIPTVKECQQDGNRTRLDVLVEFVNIDKPEEDIVINAVGYGVDSQDKGPGKAYSYAMKYAYLKILMLNSADDVEAGDTQHQPAVTQQALAQEVAGVKQTKEAWANALNAALKSVSTLEELNAIHKENRKQLNSEELSDVTYHYFIDLIEARRTELSQ